MLEFSLHPNVYATGRSKGLIHMLEQLWVRNHTPGDGTFYIISGFANYNGGVRFYEVFREHIIKGGKVVVYIGGSTAQKLSSQQTVEALLDCGAEVHVINRKRLMHAKCYGIQTTNGQQLVVTSGNFTGPGMSQNVESAIMLDDEMVTSLQFSWSDLVTNLNNQRWLIYRPSLANKTDPVWKLLYDERAGNIRLDETEEVTLLVTLGHHDTARIQASPGTNAGKGSQYFWLSRDSYDFFPPLTIRNKRGHKATFSTLVTLHYKDLGVTETSRVTFEAENNLDFRLGTGKLRYTNIAASGDLAAISRVADTEYELRIIARNTKHFNDLFPYAIHFIGYRGKQFGYISNQEFIDKTGFKLSK